MFSNWKRKDTSGLPLKKGPAGLAMGYIAALMAIPLFAIMIWGVSILSLGLFLGSLAVLGAALTIEQIPGFWAFATTRVGMIVVSLGMGYLVHLTLGTATVTGMVAAAWAMCLKGWILIMKRKDRLYERRGWELLTT